MLWWRSNKVIANVWVRWNFLGLTTAIWPFIPILTNHFLFACFDLKQPNYSGILINSLWPSDALWPQRFGSTLAQGTACCLTAASHNLSQCWLETLDMHCRTNLKELHNIWHLKIALISLIFETFLRSLNGQWVNLWSSHAMWCHKTCSSLIQTIPYCLFGLELLPESMLAYDKLDQYEHISVQWLWIPV